MEVWFPIVITLCAAALIWSLTGLLSSSSAGHKIPPGPITLPVIGNLLWLRKSFAELGPILRSLHAKHGPMVTLHIGSRQAIFVSDRFLAHQALIRNGAAFAGRPVAVTTQKIMSCDQHNISSAFYGPTWRALRRNLTAEILNAARVRSYSRSRRRVLEVLLDRLGSAGKEGAVRPVDHFRYAMSCLLVLMCFGDRLEEQQIREVESLHRGILLSTSRFAVLNLWPRVGKFLFRRRWEEFHELRSNQQNVLLPLIRARSEGIDGNKGNDNPDNVVSYVDTLLNLKLPPEDGNRKLTEAEVIALCSEFLIAGTDTTSTALQWIMANIVKSPKVQHTLYSEIRAVMGPEVAAVEEEDLQRLPYLKAVVLEGLRRHPPGHFVLPHAVTEDTELGGHMIPKNGTVNFVLSEMGWDPAVWEDPMTFKPERFLSDGGGPQVMFDMMGTREIKMMPFGVGRRMCPGMSLALLHLEYFVANLVMAFEWKAVDGDEVDLSEKQEVTVVMKNPLQAVVSPRSA